MFLGNAAIRLAPGAFHQLTGLSASSAMDAFLPLESVFENFDKAHFFSLPFTQAQVYFKEFIRKAAQHRTPDMFTGLFNTLYQSIPALHYGRLKQHINFPTFSD